MAAEFTPDHEKAATAFMYKSKILVAEDFPEIGILTENLTSFMLKMLEENERNFRLEGNIEWAEQAQESGDKIDIISSEITIIDVVLFGNDLKRVNLATEAIRGLAPNYNGEVVLSGKIVAEQLSPESREAVADNKHLSVLYCQFS